MCSVWKSVWILVVTLSLVSCSVSPRRRNTKYRVPSFRILQSTYALEVRLYSVIVNASVAKLLHTSSIAKTGHLWCCLYSVRCRPKPAGSMGTTKFTWRKEGSFQCRCGSGVRTCSFSTKIWQMVQSSATKAENLENDITEAATRPKNWAGRREKLPLNVGWNRTKARTREVFQVGRRGVVSCSSNSKTKQVKTKCG